MHNYFSRKRTDIETLKMRVMYLEGHGLLTFSLPRDAGKALNDLAFEIGNIDKRAHRLLGVGTPEWEAVIMLLVNAISIGLHAKLPEEGTKLCTQSKELLEHYVAVRNRIYYLIGMTIGVLVSVLIIFIPYRFEKFLEPYFSAHLLVFICLFAGMGSIASILTRVLKMEELKQELAPSAIIVSAAGRPVVAIFFAIVVFLILEQGIVTIEIGSADNPDKFYLVVAFLCGFSERFAQDIIARVSGTKTGNE